MQMGVKLVVLKLSAIKQEDFNFKTLLIWNGAKCIAASKRKKVYIKSNKNMNVAITDFIFVLGELSY